MRLEIIREELPKTGILVLSGARRCRPLRWKLMANGAGMG